MKSPNWEKVLLLKTKQFTFYLEFLEEDQDPRNHFLNECLWDQSEYESIKNFYWFIAKVTAYKGSIECGNSFLGGNCYENKKSVLADKNLSNMLSGYIPQMIEEAKNDAINSLGDQI